MTGQTLTSSLGRWVSVLLVASVVFVLGCGNSQERYRVLSFFFDGVPDPNAPKAIVVTEVAASTQPTVITASIISRHKPFVENKCDGCHRSATGNIMEFDEAYTMCVKCHKDVPTKFERMHGPVARSACRWCHTPHESSEPALLKDPPIKVCTQCHDQQLLGNNPPQHSDGKTSCITCHGGHGGAERYFLKPGSTTEMVNPSTQPETLPAMGSPEGAATLPASVEEDGTASPVAGSDHVR